MVEKDRKVFHDQEPQLSADTLRGYKEGIVDLLHPGESVFGALRRLGGLEVRNPSTYNTAIFIFRLSMVP
jgi:hypothetical protein